MGSGRRPAPGGHLGLPARGRQCRQGRRRRRIYDYIATGGFEARYKAMEQAIDRLAAELDQDQRTSQQRWRRLARITDEIREQSMQGIIIDIIGLGGEILPAARLELEGGDSPLELPA